MMVAGAEQEDAGVPQEIGRRPASRRRGRGIGLFDEAGQRQRRTVARPADRPVRDSHSRSRVGRGWMPKVTSSPVARRGHAGRDGGAERRGIGRPRDPRAPPASAPRDRRPSGAARRPARQGRCCAPRVRSGWRRGSIPAAASCSVTMKRKSELVTHHRRRKGGVADQPAQPRAVAWNRLSSPISGANCLG